MADQRFPPPLRLRAKADFDRVFRGRCSAGDGTLVVYAAANALGHPRLGLSVSRAVGKATVRNRWKRRLREAFRLSRDELPCGVDLVVVARGGVEPPLAELRASLVHLARRAARRIEGRP
jgi:ribonuclease P protein component